MSSRPQLVKRDGKTFGFKRSPGVLDCQYRVCPAMAEASEELNRAGCPDELPGRIDTLSDELAEAVRVDTAQEIAMLEDLQRIQKSDTLDTCIEATEKKISENARYREKMAKELRKLKARRTRVQLALSGMTKQKMEDMRASFEGKEKRREQRLARLRAAGNDNADPVAKKRKTQAAGSQSAKSAPALTAKKEEPVEDTLEASLDEAVRGA